MALGRALAPLLLLPPLLLVSCATPRFEQRAWIEVRSPNFSILTDLDRDEAVRLSEELELFRAVVAKVTDARVAPRVPTRIVAFARRSDLRSFGADRWVSGFFQAGLRENLVMLDASGARTRSGPSRRPSA